MVKLTIVRFAIDLRAEVHRGVFRTRIWTCHHPTCVDAIRFSLADNGAAYSNTKRVI